MGRCDVGLAVRSCDEQNVAFESFPAERSVGVNLPFIELVSFLITLLPSVVKQRVIRKNVNVQIRLAGRRGIACAIVRVLTVIYRETALGMMTNTGFWS